MILKKVGPCRKSIDVYERMCSIIATQLCSSDAHLLIKCPEPVSFRFNNLIKLDTYMYRISKCISGKHFLPTCLGYQIHSKIAHDHDLGTTNKIIELEIRKSVRIICVLFNFFQHNR